MRPLFAIRFRYWLFAFVSQPGLGRHPSGSRRQRAVIEEQIANSEQRLPLPHSFVAAGNFVRNGCG